MTIPSTGTHVSCSRVAARSGLVFSSHLPTLWIIFFEFYSILKSDAAFVFLNAGDSDIAASSVETLRIQHVIGEKNLVREFLNRRWVTSFNLVKTVNIFDEEFAIWYRTVEAAPAENEMNFAFATFSSGSTKLVPKVIKVPHQCILPNILDLKYVNHICIHHSYSIFTNLLAHS